jgi:Cof subfamily protein (haloacid dehalogenase superfamily)
MPKLVFVDLDDTLLNKDKTITKKNKEVIKKALDEGNIVSICSGRSIYGGSLALKELGIEHENLYQICYHGGLARNVKSNEIYFKDPLSMEQTVSILKASIEEGVFPIAFSEKGIYVPSEGKEFKQYIKITHEEHYVYESPEELREKDVKIYKILLADFEFSGKLEKFQENFREREKQLKLNSFFSCPEYLEYVKDTVDKGTGLKALTRTLSFDIKDTIAIGDERNDLSMIKAAALGSAVNNAHDEVKKIADYIAENDNEHSAVAEVIEKFVLKNA